MFSIIVGMVCMMVGIYIGRQSREPEIEVLRDLLDEQNDYA